MNTSLFDNPIMHTDDPMSSQAAAKKTDETGRRARHAALVLNLVTAYPNSTACELWARCSASVRYQLVEMQEIRRRLTDLYGRGEVYRHSGRLCMVRGTRQCTWEATGKAPGIPVTLADLPPAVRADVEAHMNDEPRHEADSD